MAERSNAPLLVAAAVVAAVVLGATVWLTRPGGMLHGEEDGHDHTHPAIALYDVNDPAQVVAMKGADAPTLAASVKRASDGGWDLKLETTRFRYLPEDAPTTTVVAGEGHAHLYIDGTYVNQFSAGNFHLEPLAPGVHTIDVGLYAVDHRAYVVDGKLLTQRVVVQVPQPGKGPRTPGPAKAFSVVVVNGKAAGSDTLRVTQNDALELRWVSDVAATLHLEGYDIEFQVSPQLAVVLLFDATLVGRFPIQGHAGDGRDTGAVMYLEVYP